MTEKMRGPDPEQPRSRKPYEAPSVKKVPLRPQEAVLGFCKNNTSAGPRGGNCHGIGACSTQGT